MRVAHCLSRLLLCFVAVAAGCSMHHGGAGGMATESEWAVPNPMFVPTVDREFFWNQVVDAVDNYFKIEKEVRLRQIGDTLIEGRIDTYPVDGSTILEPWRKDSTHGFEKLHSTFQSTMRKATVRVSPAQGGYMVYVVVQKYVEDVARPLNATSSRRFAEPESPNRSEDQNQSPLTDTVGWIPIGRDQSLEQRILADIRDRVTQ